MISCIKLLRGLPLGLLAACGGGGSGGQTAPELTRIGMANPASVYCNERGGRLEQRGEAQAALLYCHLPDGSVIEEWKLYRDSEPL
ncbi:DUF333 domain-containing protein [Fertoeibacter niger]|nr:DUF333 domain-containing protein [Fertoeibacter niger]